MELPKNITQIGETDKSCKIYMEDYVVSYMKQMNRFAEEKNIALALYGRRSTEQSISYNFIYGAAKLSFLQREVKHLSQAQNQEIEKLHKKYFPECEFVGYLILNGEMIEGMYLQEASGCRYVKGYACFYEKNDCMLGYMLDNRVEEAKPEEVPQDKYDDVRKRQEERKQQYAEEEGKTKPVKGSSEIEKRMKSMRFAAASMFVLLCLVSIVTLQTEGVNGETGTKIKNLWGKVAQKEEEDADVEAMSGDVVNTLVAQEQLAEAIRKENEQSTEVLTTQAPETESHTATPESVETEAPQETATPVPTETPTIEPTQAPTSVPTQEPTAEPAAEPVQSTTTYDTYTIREGDTLLGISLKRYGNGNYVNTICKLNNISNPDNIQIGQKILLP